jgi:hypothetical protein
MLKYMANLSEHAEADIYLANLLCFASITLSLQSHKVLKKPAKFYKFIIWIN